MREALQRKMVFVGGPRQVGKTTLAFAMLGAKADEGHAAYLNWDHPDVPPRLRRAELPAAEPLLRFDEIHKYARWRNLLKGIYDTEKSRRKILVTGSARLGVRVGAGYADTIDLRPRWGSLPGLDA